MPVRIASDQIQNLQQIEAVVAGPDGANRLFTIAGQCTVSAGVPLIPPEKQKGAVQTFTVLIGPKFTRQQFVRAIAGAWFTKTSMRVESEPPPFGFAWEISSVDADWDDESGQVELRIEVSMQVSGGAFNLVEVGSLGFQVTILAAIAA